MSSAHLRISGERTAGVAELAMRWWPIPFLLLWPLALALPSLMGGNASRALFLGFMIVGLLPLVPKVALPMLLARRLPTESVPMALFFMGLVFAIYRAPEQIMNGTAKAGAAVGSILFFVFVTLAILDGYRRERINALFYAVPIFVAVSMSLYVMYPSMDYTAYGSPSSVLLSVGIMVPRAHSIPGVAGASNIAIVAGFSILCLTYLINENNRLNALAMALTIPSVSALLLSDTRGTIFGTLIFVILYLSMNARLIAVISKYVIVIGAFSALILTWLFSLFNAIGLGQLFGRDEDILNPLGAGTGRPYIWEAVFRELHSFKIEHVLGYGLFGDTRSGVSNSYSWMFYGLDGIPTYHNTALQYILDAGYVTFILLFVILYISVTRISASTVPKNLRKVLMLSVGLLCLGGMTEAVLAVQKFESLCIGLAVVAIAFALPQKNPQSHVRLGR